MAKMKEGEIGDVEYSSRVKGEIRKRNKREGESKKMNGEKLWDIEESEIHTYIFISL